MKPSQPQTTRKFIRTAFCETDFTEDLKSIDAPVIVVLDDDQIVPIANAALLTAKMVISLTPKRGLSGRVIWVPQRHPIEGC